MLDFDKLWNAYPQEHSPCRLPDGDPSFPNQCAIRFGVCLIDGGVDVSTFPGVRCWHGHHDRHLLRGEEIAAWMKRNRAIFGSVEITQNADESMYAGRRGLIFCRNFWGPGSQGDHIDLWNKDRMQTGSPSYIARSQETWFWQLDSTALVGRRGKRKVKGKSKKKGK